METAKDQWLPVVKGEGGKGRQSTEELQGSETILYDIVVVEHFSKLLECATPEVNLDGSYGPGVISMVNEGSLIATNVAPWCRTLKVEAEWKGTGDIQKLHVLSAQLDSQPKTALKIVY